jgi:hypothetical protein
VILTDAGSWLEVIVSVLSFAASSETWVVILVVSAASVYGVLFIVTVVAEDEDWANVTSRVAFELVVMLYILENVAVFLE